MEYDYLLSHLEDAFRKVFLLAAATTSGPNIYMIYMIYILYVLKMSNLRTLLFSVGMIGTSWRCLPLSSTLAYIGHIKLIQLVQLVCNDDT